MGRLGRNSYFVVNGSVHWRGGVNKEDMNYHSGKGTNYSRMFKFYVRIQEDDVFALENFTTGSETCQNDWDLISFTRRTTRWNCKRSYVFTCFQTFFVWIPWPFLFTSCTRPRALLSGIPEDQSGRGRTWRLHLSTLNSLASRLMATKGDLLLLREVDFLCGFEKLLTSLLPFLKKTFETVLTKHLHLVHGWDQSRPRKRPKDLRFVSFHLHCCPPVVCPSSPIGSAPGGIANCSLGENWKGPTFPTCLTWFLTCSL